MSDCRCSFAVVATTGKHQKYCPVYMQERISMLEKVAKALMRRYNRSPFETLTFEERVALIEAGYLKEQVE